jgi:hypothetical protein
MLIKKTCRSLSPGEIRRSPAKNSTPVSILFQIFLNVLNIVKIYFFTSNTYWPLRVSSRYTPKYLMYLETVNLRPLSLNLCSIGIGSLGLRKMISSVLVLLSEILFARSQDNNFFKSELTFFWIFLMIYLCRGN